MDNEVFYKSIKSENGGLTLLDYYIIPENISADYCDLKCYGVKIQKTNIYEGGGKIVEINQINNIFYRYKDIEEFMKVIVTRKTEPQNLRGAVEKYIVESIDRARKSA